MRRFTALLLTALCLVALISCVCNVETETPAPVKEVDASSQLEATGTLETTQEASVKLMLKDAAGAPIQNAVVECYLDSQRIGSLKTDAQGEALFDKLIPGTYSFKVKAEGYKEAELADVKVETNSKLAIEVKAEPVTAVVTEPEVAVVTEPEEVVVTEP
ncbi:MAG TPA: carboxypeptidase-like regulatory domain-containing protein, partial [Candidatus Cloacimonadota bacterium]|nr:carboxypeptidase-like regulatory domain-containing protein [Candidatus Cloacimonadota bacterium]